MKKIKTLTPDSPKVSKQLINSSISVVVPVFNEERYIIQVVEGIEKVLKDHEYEIIVVDDGSTDSTRKILKKLAFDNPKIVTLLKEANTGKGDSLKMGFLKSSNELVIVQDADLEYSPRNYPDLLEPFFTSNADVVFGSRLMTNKPHRVMYFWHYQVNKMLTLFSNMFTNLNLTDMETGYKCFKGEIIRSIAPSLTSKRFGFEPEITAKVAHFPQPLKIYEVGISYEGRTYADGKKIGWRDGVEAIWCVIKYNLLSN